MRIAWVHNYDARGPGNGMFMWQLYDEFERQGRSIREVRVSNLRSVAGVRTAMQRIRAETAGCDIVHTQYGSLVGWLGSRTRARSVVTLRGSDWHIVPARVSVGQFMHGVTANQFTRRSLPGYDSIITCSTRMQREIQAACGPLDVHAIPDGIDLERFQPLDRMQCRARIGAAGDRRPGVLFSSYLAENALKRKSLAEAAIARARREVPDIVVRFMSGVPHADVPLHINAANAVILTSTHEGWPNIIKEAVACNVPFVSTDVSDLAAIAGAAPSCHVAAADPETLGAALVHSLNAPRDPDLRRHVAFMEMRRTVDAIWSLYEAVHDRGR